MKYQPMYHQNDAAQIEALCRRARMAHLLLLGEGGAPLAGWTNAPRLGPGHFMVHLASNDPQAEALSDGCTAWLSFSEILSTIPSHWLDAQDASRATSLYLHAEFTCVARVLENGPAAFEALEGLMRHFQPEGRHLPLHGHEAFYRPKTADLKVALLEVQSARTKWKVGQVWTPERRRAVLKELKQRGRPEDQRSAAEMEAWFGPACGDAQP